MSASTSPPSPRIDVADQPLAVADVDDRELEAVERRPRASDSRSARRRTRRCPRARPALGRASDGKNRRDSRTAASNVGRWPACGTTTSIDERGGSGVNRTWYSRSDCRNTTSLRGVSPSGAPKTLPRSSRVLPSPPARDGSPVYGVGVGISGKRRRGGRRPRFGLDRRGRRHLGDGLLGLVGRLGDDPQALGIVLRDRVEHASAGHQRQLAVFGSPASAWHRYWSNE